MELNELRDLTAKLLKYNEEAALSYAQCRETGESADFYKVVKPFADRVKADVEEWQERASKWVISNKPKYIYPMQIKNAAENLQMVSVQAFFPKTSLKRFNEHVRSIEYILSGLIEELDDRLI
jgi:hypothetical protein